MVSDFSVLSVLSFVSLGNGPFACKDKGVSFRSNEQTSHLVALEPP